MTEYQSYTKNLNDEAKAFDSQIVQRIKGGHIPDLVNTEDCDYFHNNSWRKKYFVELDFGEQCDLILHSLNNQIGVEKSEIKILEVGSGPGYMSLELARAGYNVTGIELSADCVSVAIETAKKFSPELLGSCLKYICDDFFAFSENHVDEFDVILFVGVLHHFPNQKRVHLACKKLLKANGLLICHEPVRDKVTKRNAVANVLVSTLLSVCESYYLNVAPEFDRNLDKVIDKKFNQLRYELEGGDKAQSINDNEAGFEQMYPLLEENYETLKFNWRYGLFHEIIGGIRLSSADLESKTARFIRDIDRIMCKEDLIDPTEFYFVGKNTN